MSTSSRIALLSLSIALAVAAGCDSGPTNKPPEAKPVADPKVPPPPKAPEADTKDPKSDLPEGLELNPPEKYPGYPIGYLSKEELPNSLELLPPPPAKGSTALAHDEAISKAAFALKGKPRWTQAITDANMELPPAVSNFSCALGLPITAADTPHLFRLLARISMDAGALNSAAKEHHKRPRPFMVHNEEPCFDKELLLHDGSYPSSHSTFGLAWALVLAELAPDRAGALIQRGRKFAENRMICNAHWQSDILQGRFTAGILVPLLHTKPAFRADLEMARRDIAALRAKNSAPTVDCAAEAAALTDEIPGVL
jgi:acid phosphatase (class A)